MTPGGSLAGRLTRGSSLGRAVVALLLPCLLLAACGGDPKPYQAAIDSLSMPASWQVARTVVKGGSSPCVSLADAYCPSAWRYYLPTGALPDLFQDARKAVVDAGFTDLFEGHPNCDLKSNGAVCVITATRGDVRLEINLYPPGEDVDSLGLSLPDRPTIRIVAH
ncbi:MAG: hypothetical protein HY263_07960 [Chloroflexi bacterium]|nr:hypothetical protein [Chloroflexota bacterium]